MIPGGLAGVLVGLVVAVAAAQADPGAPGDYGVVADGIPTPLTTTPGRAAAGRGVFVDRERGHCLLCHAVSSLDEPFQGNLGPELSTVGKRLSAAQLRLRIVDNTRLNPHTVMPSYYRTEGLNQVGAPYRGQPVLTAREVEDVIAFLLTLHGEEAMP
ncbi:MAG: sulfur oxidation c-type cytochrome SoxX [Candidatus Competibacterales bacterium]